MKLNGSGAKGISRRVYRKREGIEREMDGRWEQVAELFEAEALRKSSVPVGHLADKAPRQPVPKGC